MRSLLPKDDLRAARPFDLHSLVFATSLRAVPLSSLPRPIKSLSLLHLLQLGNASHHLSLSETFELGPDTYLLG